MLQFLKQLNSYTYTYEGEQFIPTQFDFENLTMVYNYDQPAQVGTVLGKVECYNPTKNHFQKEVIMGESGPKIKFQAGETGPGMLIIHEYDPMSKDNYTQCLQLYGTDNDWIWPQRVEHGLVVYRAI